MQTQCHSKEWVSLIARYVLHLLPFTLTGFALMLLRSDLPQDLQRKKVCQRKITSVKECRGRERLKIESSWCPICSNRKKNKHKSRPWKTVAHFIFPRASKHQCQRSSIHLLHHSSVNFVAKQKLKGPLMFIVWHVIRTLGLEDLDFYGYVKTVFIRSEMELEMQQLLWKGRAYLIWLVL